MASFNSPRGCTQPRPLASGLCLSLLFSPLLWLLVPSPVSSGEKNDTYPAAPSKDFYSKTLIPALLNSLKDADEEVRQSAEAALVGLDKVALPALIQLLKGQDNSLKLTSANILARMAIMGRRHLEALPALAEALMDPEVGVRRAAARAISQIATALNPKL